MMMILYNITAIKKFATRERYIPHAFYLDSQSVNVHGSKVSLKSQEFLFFHLGCRPLATPITQPGDELKRNKKRIKRYKRKNFCLSDVQKKAKNDSRLKVMPGFPGASVIFCSYTYIYGHILFSPWGLFVFIC